MLSNIITKLKDDFMKTSYRVYLVFLVLLLLCSLLSVACVSVGPSREYVQRDSKNADELLPLLVSLVEIVTQEQLSKAVKGEDKENLQNATSNGVEIYKMGLIRKIKNWHFLINSEKDVLQRHDKQEQSE